MLFTSLGICSLIIVYIYAKMEFPRSVGSEDGQAAKSHVYSQQRLSMCLDR